MNGPLFFAAAKSPPVAKLKAKDKIVISLFMRPSSGNLRQMQAFSTLLGANINLWQPYRICSSMFLSLNHHRTNLRFVCRTPGIVMGGSSTTVFRTPCQEIRLGPHFLPPRHCRLRHFPDLQIQTGHLWHLITGAHLKDSNPSPNPAINVRLDIIADHYHFDAAGGWQKSKS